MLVVSPQVLIAALFASRGQINCEVPAAGWFQRIDAIPCRGHRDGILERFDDEDVRVNTYWTDVCWVTDKNISAAPTTTSIWVGYVVIGVRRS